MDIKQCFYIKLLLIIWWYNIAFNILLFVVSVVGVTYLITITQYSLSKY